MNMKDSFEGVAGVTSHQQIYRYTEEPGNKIKSKKVASVLKGDNQVCTSKALCVLCLIGHPLSYSQTKYLLRPPFVLVLIPSAECSFYIILLCLAFLFAGLHHQCLQQMGACKHTYSQGTPCFRYTAHLLTAYVHGTLLNVQITDLHKTGGSTYL